MVEQQAEFNVELGGLGAQASYSTVCKWLLDNDTWWDERGRWPWRRDQLTYKIIPSLQSAFCTQSFWNITLGDGESRGDVAALVRSRMNGLQPFESTIEQTTKIMLPSLKSITAAVMRTNRITSLWELLHYWRAGTTSEYKTCIFFLQHEWVKAGKSQVIPTLFNKKRVMSAVLNV